MSARSSNPVLSAIQANRRGLRKRGLTGNDLLALEAVAYVAEGKKAPLSVAAVGRRLGVTRATAHWRIGRLVAAGVVIVFNGGKRRAPGTKTVFFLNVQGVLAMCAEAVRGRLEAVKRMFRKAKSECVRVLRTHGSEDIKKAPESARSRSVMPQREAKSEQIRVAWQCVGAARPGSPDFWRAVDALEKLGQGSAAEIAALYA